MTGAPPIYVRTGGFASATPLQRLVAAGVAMACLGALVIAATLTPSPTGVETHLALGFDRCGYLTRSGLPCPTCGMTTSFAYFVRGDLARSAVAQPMGALLAFAATMTVWAGAYVAVSGRPAHRLLRLVPPRYYVLPLMALAVAAWAWKMYVVVTART